MVKVIPSELASVELHLNFLCFRYSNSCILVAPILNIWYYLVIRFKPARSLKLSIKSRASDSGSGDPGLILGRVGVLFP